ncbi:MAG: tetratricopeptide repeat protein [Pyrinomonadaceae bacterium]|nr:tetratricopeptide repeat protein [Pyrinomonadaceae bacterium]
MDSNEVKFYDFGPFRLSVRDRLLLKKDKGISISHKRFEILLFLVKNQGHPVSKKELLEKFWDETHVEDFNISQHIYEIRKLLKKNGGDGTYIETVPKYGYRFAADVATSKSAADEQSEDRNTIGNFDSDRAGEGSTPEKLAGNGSINTDGNSENCEKNRSVSDGLLFSRKGLFAAFLFLILILAFVGIYTQYLTKDQPAAERKIQSIAILPFKQIEGDQSEKWGLGIADSLITELSNQKQIMISPTSSVIRFVDEENLDPIEIGRNLKVDAVLVGTIQRSNETVRVNIQCIGIKEQASLWSEQFDASFSDIFSLQDDLSKRIARKFSINFAPEQKFGANSTKNIDAYKAYSKGLFHSNKIFDFSKPSLVNPDEILKTIEYFETAIEKDPQFIRAYIKLAKTYVFMGTHDFSMSMSRKGVFSKANRHAEKALELDSNSADAYAILGTLQLSEGNFSKCRELLEKAIALEANNVEANVSLGWLEVLNGNWDQAISSMKTAYLANPHDKEVRLYLVRFFLLARKPDDALTLVKKELEINPPDIRTNFYLAQISEQKGELEGAIRELEAVLEKEPENLFALVVLSRVYAKNKQFEKAKAMLALELKGLENEFGKDYTDYYVALAYLYQGNKDKALDILRKIKPNYIVLIVLRHSYNFDPIRDTKEFKQILSEMEKELIIQK